MLETGEGPRVVTVYGGPGLGKTSAAKYLALQYAEERKTMSTPTFPDGVYYLFRGQKAQQRVDRLQLDLMECLGFGASASAPADLMAIGAQQGQYFQQSSPQVKLRSRLFKQKLLIILDDLWERDVLEELLVPAQGVKYLITSQMKQIWPAAKKVRLQDPTQSEAKHILANYTEGLPTRGEFPEDIQGVTNNIISKLEYHPLSLANVGLSISETRVHDSCHWKAVSNNIHGFLDNVNDFQDNPDMYDQRYSLPVGASMMLMVESLPQEARKLLFLVALLDGKRRVPEALLKFFYRVLRGVAKPDFLLEYDNQEKCLEDRSLVTVDLHGDHEIKESILAAHELRMHYIRQNNAPDLQSLALEMLPRSTDEGVERIRNGDAEETLVSVLSAMYYEQSFQSVVVPTLQNHFRIMLNESVTIPRSIDSRIDTLAIDRVREVRREVRRGYYYPIGELVYLLDVDHGETSWKQQARECAKKIIIKLACHGQLDDSSMTCLIELPKTTSTACRALEMVLPFLMPVRKRISDIVPDVSDTFSSAYPTTMQALLTLLFDDATSTRRRVAAISPLVDILQYFEGKDMILKVGPRLTELLAMDSNPAVPVAIVNAVYKRLSSEIGMQTDMLEVLIGLVVSAKDYELRTAAGWALRNFASVKVFPEKIVSVPNALAKLFDTFLSKPKGKGRSKAGEILAFLASVPENRSKFRGMKGGVEGLGDILPTLQVTWRASCNLTKDLDKIEARAGEAARILSSLALDEELQEIIALLPGLEGGLLFLQIIQTAHVVHDRRYRAISSTQALTIIFSNPCRRTQSCVPSVGELEAYVSGRGLPFEKSLMDDAYVSVYWTRVVVHLETGAYKEALENSVLAQNHLRFSEPGPTWLEMEDGVWSYATLRQIGLYVGAMLNDYAGALSTANSMLTDTSCFYYKTMIERGLVKRLTGDFQGALNDFNLTQDYYEDRDADVLKNRGYVRHLMGDDTGARQDAEAAQRLKMFLTTWSSVLASQSGLHAIQPEVDKVFVSNRYIDAHNGGIRSPSSVQIVLNQRYIH